MIVRMTREHLAEAAKAQIEVDPTYFLSCLGAEFLEKIVLAQFVDNEEAFAYVSIVDGKIVGLISGVCRAGFYGSVIRRHLFRCLRFGFTGAMRRPRLIGDAFSLLRYNFVHKRRPEIVAEGFSWWVLAEYQIGSDYHRRTGHRISQELWDRFLVHFHDRGVRQFRLVTPADNVVSNRFYRRIHCEFVGSFPLFGSLRNLYIGKVPSHATTRTNPN
jgi:ribosomal protein S18 acetylase RimI-like enzyme